VTGWNELLGAVTRILTFLTAAGLAALGVSTLHNVRVGAAVESPIHGALGWTACFVLFALLMAFAHGRAASAAGWLKATTDFVWNTWALFVVSFFFLAVVSGANSWQEILQRQEKGIIQGWFLVAGFAAAAKVGVALSECWFSQRASSKPSGGGHT
jgi:hypothetical protein